MQIRWMDSRGNMQSAKQLGKTFRGRALDHSGKRWDYVTVWSEVDRRPIVLRLLDRAGNADTVAMYR